MLNEGKPRGRGQSFEAEAEAKASRPRPKFWPRGHGLEDLTSLQVSQRTGGPQKLKLIRQKGESHKVAKSDKLHTDKSTVCLRQAAHLLFLVQHQLFRLLVVTILIHLLVHCTGYTKMN